MSTEHIANEAVELLLAATFKTRQDGGSVQFLFGRPGTGFHDRRLGETLYFSKIGLIKAALYIRREGPVFLKNLSVSEIQNKLTNFLTENYGHISGETWLRPTEEALAGNVSPAAKTALASAMARSPVFAPVLQAILFPLVPVEIVEAYESEPFFVVAPKELTPQRLRRDIPPGILLPDQFPPLVDWQGIRHSPGAWLGIRAASLSTARKMRSALLGAIALLPHRLERHVFTGRKMFGGSVVIDNGWSVSFGNPHTPPLSENITIGAADHGWLQIISAKLLDPSESSRRAIMSLEYFYRAWFLNEAERFPWLFMALDAMFGDQNGATKAVIESVSPIIGNQFDDKRLRLLLRLRGSVMHGGAPDVYESSKYFEYYEKYGDDPIADLDLITAATIRKFIFENTLSERPHTHAGLIKSKTGMDV